MERRWKRQVAAVGCTLVLGACLPQAQATAAARSATGVIALRAALEMVGIPYSWGGGGPGGPGYGIGRGSGTKGFDCSGLAEYAYARAGALICTTTTEQWRSGVRLPRELLEPGDLVFFDNDAARQGPEHVGLVVDGEHMVHAPHTGAQVRVDRLDRPDLLGLVRPEAGRDLGGRF